MLKELAEERGMAAAIGVAVAIALRQRQGNEEAVVRVAPPQSSEWRTFSRFQQMRGSLNVRSWKR